MKLQSIKENTTNITPEQVMAAALAVINVRGKYAKASEQQSTKNDVLAVVFSQGQADPALANVQTLMNDPTIQKQAQTMCDWIRNYKLNPSDASGFLGSAQSVFKKPAVTDRMVGFIVGVVPFYQREVGTPNAQGNTLTRSWPQEWDEVKMLWKTPVVVQEVKDAHSQFSGAYFKRVTLVLDDKYLFDWILNIDATPPKEGSTIPATGYLEKDDRGRIKFIAHKKWARRLRAELGIGDKDSGDD